MSRLIILTAVLVVAAALVAGVVRGEGPNIERGQRIVDGMPTGFAGDICIWLWERGVDPEDVYYQVRSSLVGYSEQTRLIEGTDYYHTTSDRNRQGQRDGNSYWVLWRSDRETEVARRNKSQWFLKYSNTPHAERGAIGYRRVTDSEPHGNHWAYRFAIAYTNSNQDQYLDVDPYTISLTVPLYDVEAQWVYSPAGWPWPAAAMSRIWGSESACSGLIG